MRKANIIFVLVNIIRLLVIIIRMIIFLKSPALSGKRIIPPGHLPLLASIPTPRFGRAEPGQSQTITRNRPISILQLSWGRSGRWSRWLWCRLVTVVVLCRSDESNILAAPRSFTFVLCCLVLVQSVDIQLCFV